MKKAIISAGKLREKSNTIGKSVNITKVVTTKGSRCCLSAKWEVGMMHRVATRTSIVVRMPTSCPVAPA